MLKNAYIPYKAYFSSPFARWQGSLANEHAIKLGAERSRDDLDSLVVHPLDSLGQVGDRASGCQVQLDIRRDIADDLGYGNPVGRSRCP